MKDLKSKQVLLKSIFMLKTVQKHNYIHSSNIDFNYQITLIRVSIQRKWNIMSNWGII
jgi:hypothetical protein